MGGGAVVQAAAVLKRQIARVVAPHLGCPPEAIRFKQDRIWGDNEETSMSFDEAVAVLFREQEFPHAFGAFKGPRVTWDEETGQGIAYFTWVYACQAVELTVNRKTGKVTLLKAYAAHDVGRAVNPPMVLGQFYGGMAMSIGYALHEDLRIDEGRITTLNFGRYRIPRASDLPEMKGVIIENPDPLSPSGAKGIGEPTNELMAPAIANAVHRAIGRRFRTLPIRIEAER
jgi:CO/xanthine dehydrogenase Mo-binding subunit